MPRYTLCPYYIDENKRSISCEDACRSFASHNKKWKWMDMYCDSWDWMKCPYAADISEAYKRYEEGDEMALVEQKLKAQKKEIESLIRKLGRANKKLDKERAKNEDLESQKRIYFEKWRKADEQLRDYEKKIADQLGAMAGIYEQRMCYLMDKFAEGFFCESDAATWAEDKEFALVSEYDEELCDRIWKVVFKEDAAHDNQGISGDDETEAQV